MKIAHFSAKDTVGAFGAAYDLHKALKDMGEESYFFVKEKTRNDQEVIVLEIGEDQQFLDNINEVYFRSNIYKGNSITSFPYPSIHLDKKTIEFFEQFDVFHMHWISGFISYETIAKLSFLGKPIFWTLHDQYPLTACCHYTHGCEKYKEGCNDCPQLVVDTHDITKYLFEVKNKYIKNNVTIIATSNWMVEMAKNSKLYNHSQINIIPYSIDTQVFYPKSKVKSKNALGFSEDTKIILIGAQSLNQRVKGYDQLYKTLQHLLNEENSKSLLENNNLHLVTFGSNVNFVCDFPIPCKNMGFISDKGELATLYSAADVFVFPSIEEAFGLTSIEAMACGTPVVAFNICAMKDVIIDGTNGYKSEINDYSKMSENINKVLQSNGAMSESCREFTNLYYKLDIQAKKMLKLYKEISDKQHKNERRENLKIEDIPQIDRVILPFIKDYLFEMVTSNSNDSIGQFKLLELELQMDHLSKIAFITINYLIKNKKLLKHDKIIIYGAANLGEKFLKTIKYFDLDLIGYVDSDSSKWEKTFCGYKILSLLELERIKSEKLKIIIASASIKEISETLNKMGFTNDINYFAFIR